MTGCSRAIGVTKQADLIDLVPRWSGNVVLPARQPRTGVEIRPWKYKPEHLCSRTGVSRQYECVFTR